MRSPGTSRLLALVVVAGLAVAARLPFLERGEQFFDSDEAVEGLMARHVFAGEVPAFMWGQNYKGVPEVYIAAAWFALAGASVSALKAATLTMFVAFVVCQFVLVERLFSRRVAWLTVLFLIAGPPVLVYWSLSGSGEIAATLLAGSVLVLAWTRWRETRSAAALAAACAAAGAGLWVQQFIVYYIVALAIASGRSALPPVRSWVPRLLLGVAALYGVLGVLAFFTPGFDLPFGIAVHHPQKMWRIGAVLVALWLGAAWLRSLGGRERAVAVAAFAAGYLPAVLFRLASGGGMPPLARMDAPELIRVVPLIARSAVPMLLGFAGPTGDALPLPIVLSALLLVLVVLSYIAVRQTGTSTVFHVFLITTPIVVLASGAYGDVQSYRYLMPLFAALPVVAAVGAAAVWDRHRLAGLALASALVMLGAWQQWLWIKTLGPDLQTRAVIACLEREQVHAAYADYWLSYKLTFLTNEARIVAPNDGIDRYPPYTDRVRAAGNAPTIVRPPWPNPQDVPCDRVLVTN